MKKQLIKIGVGSAAMLAIAVVFQNCGQTGFQTTNSSMDAKVGPTAVTNVSDLALVKLNQYFYKCAYRLRGPNGAIWDVERYSTSDNCALSTSNVLANNPSARILSQNTIHLGYNDDGSNAPYYWMCAYQLRGQNGSVWSVERRSKADDKCAAETSTVSANNPSATILSAKSVFQGYHTDTTGNLFHWRCDFQLRGQNGFVWESERYLKFDDDCQAARLTVEANNPNAAILSVNEVFLGYD